MPTRGVRFVTGRVNARAALPEMLDLLARQPLSPVVQAVVRWEDTEEQWPG